jgi:predicted MPP superfamily phosphohydrolase
MPWQLRMILTITPFLFIAEIYLLFRIRATLKNIFNEKIFLSKLAVFVLLLILNILPICLVLFFLINRLNHFFLSEPNLSWLDFLINFPFWWALILTFEVLPYFLSTDIISFLFNRFKINTGKLFPIVRITIFVFFLFFVTIRTISDTFFVKNEPSEVFVKNLPMPLENFNITLIGDIHFDRYLTQFKSNQLKKRLLQQPVNLLLFSGDLVSRGDRFIQKALDFMCDLDPEAFRIACMGDHDFWTNPERIGTELKKCGWKYLQNQHAVLEHQGVKILVTGLTQIYSERISEKELTNLLKTSPEADIKLLLTHQPSKNIINIASRYHYHLIFAGHTHGGQIVFKPFGLPLTPSKFENPVFTGIQNYQNLKIVITNGVGLTLAPVRYRAPAEIKSIILKSYPDHNLSNNIVLP